MSRTQDLLTGDLNATGRANREKTVVTGPGADPHIADIQDGIDFKNGH